MCINARYDCCAQKENAEYISEAFQNSQKYTDHSTTPRPVVVLARLHADVDPKANVEQDALLALNFFSIAPFWIPFAIQAHIEANAEIQKIVNTESIVKKMYGLARRHSLVQQGTIHYGLLSGALVITESGWTDLKQQSRHRKETLKKR